MTTKGLTAVILALYVSISQAGIGDLQNIVLPEGARTSWVATDMNHNGHGMAIKALAVQRPVDEVISFYRAAWEAQGDTPGFVENKVGEWQVISRVTESHNLVVQVKTGSDGTTEGFISSLALVAKPLRRADSIPLPPNAVKVSHTRTADKGKTGYTTIMVTPSSVGAAVGFYKDHLARDGWSLVSDGFLEGSHVLKFNKHASVYEVAVSAAEDGTTVILLNRTQSNG